MLVLLFTLGDFAHSAVFLAYTDCHATIFSPFERVNSLKVLHVMH